MEKREYLIEDSDGVNVMEDTVRSDPVELKRKEVNEADEENGLVTAASPAGLMLTIPSEMVEGRDSELSVPE